MDGRTGGQMAETVQQKKRAEASGKTTKAAISAKKTAPGGKAKRGAKKPTTDRVVEDGFEQLRKALGEELQKNGRRIAASLREQSVSGDMRSTKMMVELAAQKAGEKPEAKKRKRSTALPLGREAEWGSEAARKQTGEG